jgi:hypothetical protein
MASRLSMVTRFSNHFHGLMNLVDFDGLGDGKFTSRAEVLGTRFFCAKAPYRAR